MKPIRPCPCCGRTRIYCGPHSCDSQEVKCKFCGLQMVVSVECVWDKAVGSTAKEKIANADILARDMAIELWNTRTQ